MISGTRRRLHVRGCHAGNDSGRCPAYGFAQAFEQSLQPRHSLAKFRHPALDRGKAIVRSLFEGGEPVFEPVDAPAQSQYESGEREAHRDDGYEFRSHG